MTKDIDTAAVTSVGMPRRDFLRNSVLMALPVALVGAGVPLTAAAATYDPPRRQRGSTTRNVRNYGARGNGSHDDTAAIQSAINSLPASGGTVYVPAGTYMIDALRSINLRNYMHLKLDPDAKLVAKPNGASRYAVVSADRRKCIEISGGQILGERAHHKGTSGEGGHCILIKGSLYVTIRDLRAANGWGDGISVGPRPRYRQHFVYSRDVAVANVVCTGNRRNGLSITNVIGMKVYDSEFSNTHGTSPQCGIDVEPNGDIDGKGYNDNVRIQNCVMRGNAAYGINVWRRSRNLTVAKCTIEDNKSCGMVTTGLHSGTFTGNMFRNNMKTGLFIKDGSNDIAINGNTSYNNYLKLGRTASRDDFSLSGVSGKVEKDLIVGRNTSNIRVGTNRYK